MKKDISRDGIIKTALQIVEEKEGVTGVNFREIARRLNCAHTNLYNYFDSLEDILWAAQEEIQKKIRLRLQKSFAEPCSANEKINSFFEVFLDAYLAHKGWFYLSWMENIGERPKSHYRHTVETADEFTIKLSDVSAGVFNKQIPQDKMRMILHDIHCYLHGEVAIFTAERGIFSDPADFKKYVLARCAKLLKLMVLYGD
jgi:AcrR family transcriptional regulator